MLKTILSGETCAACRNCCIFEEYSTWELPTFSKVTAARLADRPEYQTAPAGDRVRITLPYDETHAAQPCPFLDPHSGCTLPAEEKPFACSLWPVRVMQENGGEPFLALYDGCPGVPAEKLPALRDLLDSGLRDRIAAEAEQDPSMILPYHDNYRKL